MAELHVNSTSGGTPTSPYSDWATAALTLTAANAAAVAGDIIWVHPSHSETAAAGLTTPGTPTNPVKIICGDPGLLTSGITELRNTAVWGISSSGSSTSLNGSYYIYGISLRVVGSSGVAVLSFGGAVGNICTFENCQFYYTGAGGGIMQIGSGTADAYIITTLKNCSFRFGSTAHSIRFHGRVYGQNLTVLSGGSTPTSVFGIANSTLDLPALVDIDGMDFSVLANTCKLTTTFSTMAFARFRNVKCPTGWGVLGTTNPLSADILTGSQLEILNFGDANTNYRYWIENKQGRALADNAIKVNTANASGNNTATYSKRLNALTNVAFPNSVYRGPPITKYVQANAQYRGIFVSVAYDGAAQFTNKEFWIEVSSHENASFPISNIRSSCPDYIVAATDLPSSAETWDGLSGTGPNGSSTWNRRYAYVGSIPVLVSGWITVTPCFAVPSKTIFVNDDFEVADEGLI